MSARIKPIRVRGRQLEEIRDADPDGRPVLHSQVIDPLTRMLREGTLCGPGESTPGARAVDATLADVVAGRHPGRAKDTDVVLSNPFGMGVLDVALAADVYDAALARDLGTVLEP